jgi:hypothetical protein
MTCLGRADHLLPARLVGDVLRQKIAEWPAAVILATTSLPRGSSTSVTTTRAPSRASVSAHAAPMPDAPPVTIAIFPCTCPKLVSRCRFFLPTVARIVDVA